MSALTLKALTNRTSSEKKAFASGFLDDSPKNSRHSLKLSCATFVSALIFLSFSSELVRKSLSTRF